MFLGKVKVKIPSIRHLIAMKIHALRENWEDRELKDLEDIRQLIRKNDIATESEDFKELCLKYGNEKIYRRIQELA